MDRISYAGSTVITGTDIAHALLDYAQALSQAGHSAAVQIPTVDDDGAAVTVEVLIGPASQILSASIPGDEIDVEIEDAELVRWLTVQAASLRQNGPPGTPVDPYQPPPPAEWDEFSN